MANSNCNFEVTDESGLDHIQVSFQASTQELNDLLAGTQAFEHKLAIARAVKENGFPMVLCFVMHRDNIDSIGDVLEVQNRGADAMPRWHYVRRVRAASTVPTWRALASGSE